MTPQPSQQQEDAKKVAQFIFLRVFPMMDDFFGQNPSLRLTTEAALIRFLGIKATQSGLTKDFILRLVEDGIESKQDGLAAFSPHIRDNIVQFPMDRTRKTAPRS